MQMQVVKKLTLLLLLAASALLVFLVTTGIGGRVTQAPTSNLEAVSIGEFPIFVTIASTTEARARGLGGRTHLAPNEGMLFVFDTEGQYSFWMKDMKFAIDILWVGSEGKIVYVEEAVAPSTYPQSFTSSLPARYVLELPEGFTRSHDIKVGDVLSMENLH